MDPATRSLLDACVRLTHRPWQMESRDIDELRSHGWEDDAIHDAFQIAAYFNYMTRLCDGLGVDLEDWMPPPRG